MNLERQNNADDICIYKRIDTIPQHSVRGGA